MKKRIGTKLYDTDSALLIIPEVGLYRTQRKQTYFYFDGLEIQPLEFQEAERILREHGKEDVILHKSNYKGLTAVNISPAAADRLSAYCRRKGITQKSVIEAFIYSLLDD